jgi:hypothetical protein
LNSNTAIRMQKSFALLIMVNGIKRLNLEPSTNNQHIELNILSLIFIHGNLFKCLTLQHRPMKGNLIFQNSNWIQKISKDDFFLIILKCLGYLLSFYYIETFSYIIHLTLVHPDNATKMILNITLIILRLRCIRTDSPLSSNLKATLELRIIRFQQFSFISLLLEQKQSVLLLVLLQR